VKVFFGRLGAISQDMAVTEEGVRGHQQQRQRPASISCIPKMDALWFCYSPVYQMTEYYREGTFDNCRHKWTELFGCISLKTKPQSQIQEILQERERAQQHIWEFRTPEEAGKHWKEEFGHLQD